MQIIQHVHEMLSSVVQWNGQHNGKQKNCKSCEDLRLNLFCLLQHRKNPHNPLLKVLQAHQEGAFENICSTQTLRPPDLRLCV